MIRNLKVMGLALVAVFALSAVVASAASAQGKLTSDGPVTLTGSEVGAEPDGLEAFGLKVQCPGSTITGHAYNVTPHGLIANGATTATLTPHYKQANENCTVAPGGFIATVDMNGCDYVIHIGTLPAVTLDVICPVGQEITVTIFTNAHDHTVTNKPMCILHIKEQKGLAGASVTNGVGDLNIAGTVTGIHVFRTSTGTHPVLCPSATITTGKFILNDTAKGTNGAGAATSVSVS